MVRTMCRCSEFSSVDSFGLSLGDRMSSRKARKKQQPVPASEPALQPSVQTTRWWIHGLVVLFLLIANFSLYQRTSNSGFLSVDDPDYVQNNPYIEKLDGPNLKFILTQPYAANYAPANIFSYALDVAIAGGKKASAIHFSSVMWHGWVACMVYLLAFTIRPSVLMAAAAA